MALYGQTKKVPVRGNPTHWKTPNSNTARTKQQRTRRHSIPWRHGSLNLPLLSFHEPWFRSRSNRFCIKPVFATDKPMDFHINKPWAPTQNQPIYKSKVKVSMSLSSIRAQFLFFVFLSKRLMGNDVIVCSTRRSQPLIGQFQIDDSWCNFSSDKKGK